MSTTIQDFAATGEHTKRVKVGDRVGLGWNSSRCGSCAPCLSGNQNLCAAAGGTIVGRHGGFATQVRAHWMWAAPLPEALDIAAFPLIMGQRSVSGSPPGSPSTVDTMLEFCARHHIAPVTESSPLSRVNDALDHLRNGKPRYRIVLRNDL